MKLYGVPLSQPVRSVAWTMLQLELSFEVEIAVPGTSSKIGTNTEDFQRLTPHRSTQVPVLTYTTSDSGNQRVSLTESAAILVHLCELCQVHNNNQKNDNNIPSLYPPRGSIAKAKIDSYLHWHHAHTRKLAKLFDTQLRSDLNVTMSDDDHEFIQHVLKILDTGWIPFDCDYDDNGNHHSDDSSSSSQKLFIGGLDYPTIADILAYGEISALTMTKLLHISSTNFPRLHRWMIHMSKLPHHDAAHLSLISLGDMSSSSSSSSNDANDNVNFKEEITKRIGAATNAGWH